MSADPPALPPAVAFLDSQQITTTECRRCGSQVSGLKNRYACGLCGWVNNWREGHGDLPTAADDPDADASADPRT